MSIFRIAAITGRIVSQFKRDHRTLGLLFVAPILVMSLLGFVFRSQENSVVRVGVVNEDKPPAGQLSASKAVIDTLIADKNITVENLSRTAAVEAVRGGSLKVALAFPPDFTGQLTGAHKATLEAIVEGSNPGQAGAALGTVGQAVARSSSAIMKVVLPPGLAGLAPSGAPLEVKPVRLYGTGDLKMLDFFAPMFIAYIGFFLIFLLTSVSFLRERTQGTMERLAASPVTRFELVLGYMLGFGLFAIIQALLLLLFTIYVLQVKYTGNLISIFVVTSALVVGAVNLGILLSAFARNELQAIQFIPLVILPQVFLSGLLWPVQDMPNWLQTVAAALPLTHAIRALTDVMIRGKDLVETWPSLLVLLIFAALMALLASATVRREVA